MSTPPWRRSIPRPHPRIARPTSSQLTSAVSEKPCLNSLVRRRSTNRRRNEHERLNEMDDREIRLAAIKALAPTLSSDHGVHDLLTQARWIEEYVKSGRSTQLPERTTSQPLQGRSW